MDGKARKGDILLVIMCTYPCLNYVTCFFTILYSDVEDIYADDE